MEPRWSRTIRASTDRNIDYPDEPFVNWANAVESQVRNLRTEVTPLVAMQIEPTILVSNFFANGDDSLG
jgi:hypothetical protein